MNRQDNRAERPRISKDEYRERIRRIQEGMDQRGLDLCVIYGDEYRRENLRYVSNYWPIFERAALVVPVTGEPVLLGAPECEQVAREMSAWDDIRIIPDFTCVTVPETIDYPLASFTSFAEVFGELSPIGGLKKVGIVGQDAMSVDVFTGLRDSLGSAALVDANELLYSLRLIKSEAEIACLRASWLIADKAYEALMKACLPGNTELQAAAAAQEVAHAEGAEAVPFIVFGSGNRSNTIVGRPTHKVIEAGDMIMAALAVQYEGYISTVEFPFVAGKEPEGAQRDLIDALIRAEAAGLEKLAPDIPAREFVIAIRDYFRRAGLEKYDVYSPLHGCGCAEAESPYPDENSDLIFKPGMTVNTDISLFGHPGGGNRVEEGFVITDKGAEPMSPLVRRLCEEWLDTGRVSIG